MIKKLLFPLIIILSLSYISKSQGLNTSLKVLNFGTVYETETDSINITIYNIHTNDITVNNISTFNIYGNKPFYIKDNNFTINAGDSLITTIYFKPIHNIFHNSEIIFHVNEGLGDLKIDLQAQGCYTKEYYNITQNVSEQALKDSLKKICSRGQISLGYDAARDSLYMIIDNEKINGQGALQNQLHCVYTNYDCVGYINRIEVQNNCAFNCEHTWPQSHFGSGSVEPMKSDMHHLFPCYGSANSTRNNHPFGIVDNPTSVLDGGSKYGNGIFEPRDFHKGRASRIMFYFVARYENYDSFMDQMETTLRLWDKNFIVDSIEIRRNEDIFRMQKNRNPFVDYPQFIDRISLLSHYSYKTKTQSICFNDSLINYGYIPENTDIIYNYIIVNNGDTAVKLSNFNLSNPQILSFVYGNNDTLIEAGDALEVGIKINIANHNLINECMTFNTDINNLYINNIPITANNSSSVNTYNNLKNFVLYPNPTENYIYIESKDIYNMSEITFKLNNINGQNINIKHTNISINRVKIDLVNLSTGIYYLNLYSKNGDKLYSTAIIKKL